MKRVNKKQNPNLSKIEIDGKKWEWVESRKRTFKNGCLHIIIVSLLVIGVLCVLLDDIGGLYQDKQKGKRYQQKKTPQHDDRRKNSSTWCKCV